MTKPIRKKLIEVAMPLDAINAASAREKSIRHGHPSTLHLWWARRPLAACRAVLFGQLVDDPSSWPEFFPTEEGQDRERERLFKTIEAMVPWEATNDETIINASRLEIAKSIARGRKADGEGTKRDDQVLAKKVSPEVVNAFLAEIAPPVHDPFAGGGSIPLEAQRLGLRAIATDLNPVAVLINKALIEIPPKFAGMPPVNTESRKTANLRPWKGSEGMAEDVRYYGEWMKIEAHKRIGHLYPPVRISSKQGISEFPVLAWLWCRTVRSPDPSLGGAHVPLVSSFWLSKRPNSEAWIKPRVDHKAHSWDFVVHNGRPKDKKAVDTGTKTGRGDFFCIFSGAPIPASYVRSEGKAGRLRDRLIAVVAKAPSGRVYLSPESELEDVARVEIPDDVPETNLPKKALGFRVQQYGITKHRQLFTPRQLTALSTFVSEIKSAHSKVQKDAACLGISAADGKGYADAIAMYLSFAVNKMAEACTALCTWSPLPTKLHVVTTFGLQTLSMKSDFAEANVFGDSVGGFSRVTSIVAKNVENLPSVTVQPARVFQANAMDISDQTPSCFCTDPPYYDNVAYADLSDFFYIWARKSLAEYFGKELSTILVPKNGELVAEPSRHGGVDGAKKFFQGGMQLALEQIAKSSTKKYPTTIFYAFKQEETENTKGEAKVSSTGWETMLEGV